MKQDQCGGINGTSNGDSMDPSLRKRSLVDQLFKKRDSIDLLASSPSQVATGHQDATNICTTGKEKAMDSGTRKRDSLHLNLTAESNETNEQVKQIANRQFISRSLKDMENNIDEETDNPEALAEELKDIVPEKVKIFLNLTCDSWRDLKVLDVEEIKQSLSTFSFSEDDTKFKPPKKTKGGKDNICHLLGS